MHALSPLSDEELLLLARMGNQKAETLFAERIFKDQMRQCRCVAAAACSKLDNWDINEAYFRAYTSAVAGYRFGSSRFMSYFMGILTHEIIHIMSKRMREQAQHGYVFSLDAVINDESESSCSCLSDFVASTDFMDDPKCFMIYAEELESIHDLPKNVDPLMLDVIRLVSSNYSIGETAKLCEISENRVKYLLNGYRRWAKKTLSLIQNFGKKKKKPRSKGGAIRAEVR